METFKVTGGKKKLGNQTYRRKCKEKAKRTGGFH